MALKNLNRVWTRSPLQTALTAPRRPFRPRRTAYRTGKHEIPGYGNEKLKSLEPHRKGGEGFALTTNQGVRIADDQNSLRAGSRGPTLLEDFILREKITHFDHERIPERIVHARGSAAHGYFQPYKSLKAITKADFSPTRIKSPRCLSVSPPCRAAQVRQTPCAISAALPPSFIPKRDF
jgi:hypothetical protein